MKKTNKVLAIFLAIVMMLGVMPVMAFAATEIETVEVCGVTAPKVGEDADFNWYVPKFANYSKNIDEDGDSCYWVATEEIPTTFADCLSYERAYESGYGDVKITFQKGMYYTFVALVVANDHIFSDTVNATINYEDAKVVNDGDDYLNVWCTFDCYGNAVYSNDISLIEVYDVTEPEADETLDFYWDVTYGAGYSVFADSDDDSCAWVETDEEPEVYEDLADGTWLYASAYDGDFTFQEGKYYTFVAFGSLDDGYELADDAYASLNYCDANIKSWDDGNFNVWYTFGPLEPITYIDTVDVYGVSTPVVGGNADFYWEVPEDAGYYMNYDDDGDCCAWVETDEEPTCLEDLENGVWAYESGYGDIEITFQEGKYYTFVAFVASDYSYKFSDYDLYANFNGEWYNARVDLINFHEAIIWKTFTTEDDYGYGEIYEIDAGGDMTLSYKGSSYLDYYIYSTDYTDYTLEFSSDDSSICVVDDYGNIYGVNPGTTTITMTVTDSYGNVFEDTTEVTVKYTFWQWIIIVVFFGWIWY